MKEERGDGRTAGGDKKQILPKDLEGNRFGDLVVVSYAGKRKGKHYWNCLCECGASTVVCQSNLKSGHTKSCGHRVEPAKTRHFVEGTCIESVQSRKVSASNSSGVRGVYKDKRTERWIAQITFQGKTRYLGSFAEIEEAARARMEAEKIFTDFLERYKQKGPDLKSEKNFGQGGRAEDGDFSENGGES